MTAPQIGLFEDGRVRHNRTDTSRAAAVAIQPHAGKQAMMLLEELRLSPYYGLTNEQLHELTGIRLQSVCGRMNELWRAGLIEDSGERRKGASGASAKVWRAR